MRTQLALLLAAASALAVPATQSVSYNGTSTAFGNNTYNSLALSKFNTNLGQLVSVTLTLNELSVAGYFEATAIGGNGSLSYFGTTATLRQNGILNDLGFTTRALSESTDDNLVITPGVGTALAQNVSQQFSVTKYILASNSITNVAQSKWSAYEASGAGYIYFQLKNNPSVTVTAPTGQFSSTNATAYADITVTYNYIPAAIPEPSTYGLALGGLALAGVAVRRRRKA